MKNSLARLVLAIGVAVGLVLVSAPAPASADPIDTTQSDDPTDTPQPLPDIAQAPTLNLEDHHPVTYNMQGGQGGDVTPKWANDIPQLTRNHDVVALQEAGPIPPQDPNGRLFRYQNQVTINGHVIYHYLRNFGTPSRPIDRHVYFLETDPNGHRVNLAFVTTDPPTTFWATDSAITTARPSFGVQFGNTVFNNLHGLSGSGNDIQSLLRNIDAGQRSSARDWVAMGDFNRLPQDLAGRLPANSHIYRPGVPTHMGGSEFEYMASSRSVPLYTAHAMTGISADHLPVEFGVLRPQARGPFEFGNYHSYGGGERVIGIQGASSSNGTHINVYDNRTSDDQKWEFIPQSNGTYAIASTLTHKCLDMNKGAHTGNGDWVNEWPCDANLTTQQWKVHYWTQDPGAAAIINAYTNDCLDVSREENYSGSWTVIQLCNGHGSQKWTLQWVGPTLPQ
ncbi:RICIN domain-containing protein [Nocardia sp. NPDC051570]|uniref:RICIN domain-containing protein n=1 Tax=Nocardia sp. NPDC051570 TaxID=3364324 RepID=UPI00378CF656